MASSQGSKDKKGATPDHLLMQAGGTTATFLVVVDGQEVGRFSEVAGLQVEVEMETYNEGGENGFVHHLPGRMTWPNLVLKRGVTYEDNLLAWFNRATGTTFATSGKAERTTLSVTLINGKGEFLRSWDVEGAVPVRWTGPTFAASADDMPVEELEVAHHGFTTTTHR